MALSVCSTRAPAGEVLAEYLVLTGLARFLVEFIRINPRSFFGVLTNAQVVSLLSIVAGVALMFVVRARSAAVATRGRGAGQVAKR